MILRKGIHRLFTLKDKELVIEHPSMTPSLMYRE